MRGGEGESQIEADRRKVSERIDKIERDLDAVRRQRATQRAGRQRKPVAARFDCRLHERGKIHVAQRAHRRGRLAKDIFVRHARPDDAAFKLPTNQNVLLTDTVGFIRKLPHGLVEAFKATLEEVVAGGFAAARRGREPSAGRGTNRGCEFRSQ